MIESIQFRNFKALRRAVLPLAPLTIVIGPNGSGKSTALQALRLLGAAADNRLHSIDIEEVLSVPRDRGDSPASLAVFWNLDGSRVRLRWLSQAGQTSGRASFGLEFSGFAAGTLQHEPLPRELIDFRAYSLQPRIIASPAPPQRDVELGERGENFVAVLDRLRDADPDAFEALNAELGRWLPEFDRVLFDTADNGQRLMRLRLTATRESIPAQALSDGTLIALAILTLGYALDVPPVFALEEPEHGLHPRLLRDVRDALWRLTHPEEFGDARDPKQVIVTTHSPFLLDLFRDVPECIVIAQKEGTDAYFERLVDRPDLAEILGDTQLGEAWYAGVLGGVPQGK